MKNYLLTEIPAFIVGMLLGLFSKSIIEKSIILFICYLIFLAFAYIGLTYLYQLLPKEIIIQEETFAEEENKTFEKIIPIINSEEEVQPKVKKINAEYEIEKFKVLRDLSAYNIPPSEDILVCKVNMNKYYVEIKNLDNLRIDLTRFENFVELGFIKKINSND